MFFPIFIANNDFFAFIISHYLHLHVKSLVFDAHETSTILERDLRDVHDSSKNEMMFFQIMAKNIVQAFEPLEQAIHTLVTRSDIGFRATLYKIAPQTFVREVDKVPFATVPFVGLNPLAARKAVASNIYTNRMTLVFLSLHVHCR